MATKVNGTTVIKRSFYRPHARKPEMGEIVNEATGEVTRPPSRTKQEFLAECDINNILKQYSVTGMLRHVSAKAGQGSYQDLPDPIDFQDSLHQVEAARESFMSLPSKLRARFGNDPVEFLAFCHDPSNMDEMRTLGLANPAPVPAPVVKPEPTSSPGPRQSVASGELPVASSTESK